MDPSSTQASGKSGSQVPALGLGCSPLGSLFHEVSETQAHATVNAAWDAGVRCYDTAPWYGRGLSELRVGGGLRERPRDESGERHGVPLAAAALQFVLGHPIVATVIPGAYKPEQVARNVAAFEHTIPAGMWAELKHEGLVREDAPVPG